MALTRDDLQVIATMVSAMLNERPAPVGIAAHVVPGSYTPEDGTLEALVDDTVAAHLLAAALGDEPQITSFLSRPSVPMMTHDPNDQYGPRGGEPVMLHPTQRGFAAKFIPDAGGLVAPGAGPYYSVQAPAGERWIFHRNADGTIDSGMQLTNDGPTTGDGLGGTILGNNGALTQAQTKSGHTVALNDTAQTITVETASSLLQTIYNDAAQTIKTQAAAGLYHLFDGGNNLISLVAPSGGGVALGELWGSLDGTHAAARNLDLATFAESIQTMVGNALQQAAKAAILSSVPNAAAWLAEIQSGLPSFSFTNLLSTVASLAAPDCSSLVRIAS